ncbi:MAG: bifunctional (p)ppGpp synthetase/guanosine-3',5'-bis(diphosphate) 3'-pyrophosphohydrolase [Alphaproteobacteria bacterium]
MVQLRELAQRLKKYDPTFDEELLNRAFLFSKKAHESQLRASGEPYFSHPLEVANVLINMRLDTQSVVTALLHDTVEDTLATLDEIKSLFGPEIAKLVDGVTKLSKLELQSEATRQAENFRKLVLAMSSDIRVLLIKLADRLHNMQTLHHVTNEDKRRRIARETIDIYVPLAERMGMQRMKDELEDYAFGILNEEARESIVARLLYLHKTAGGTAEEIIGQLLRDMRRAGLHVQISGREKSPYSIWRKMQRKNVAFEQLSDIMAFRLVVNTVADCYHALGVLHSKYVSVPGRFKDYISTPKPNGYQSLHTTLIGPQNQRVEMQIRNMDMHQIADLGVAAHWQYKQGTSRDGKQYAWLRSLLEILEQASGAQEFLEHTKLEMFQDQVFCFTPKGELIALPKGATPIDFAYAVHSQVGNHALSTKINGRQMPLRTILHNGDQVEIVTSKTQTPSPAWERFIVTSKARADIRKFIRNQHREEFGGRGRSQMLKVLAREGLELDDKAIESAGKHFHIQALEDVFARVGAGSLTPHDIIAVAYPNHKLSEKKTKEEVVVKTEVKKEHYKDTVSIKGLIPGMAIHFAGCCHPLPGDQIVGVVVTGRGVTVHIIKCDTVSSFSEPERLLDLFWDEDHRNKQNHVGRLRVIFANKSKSLTSLTTAIAKSDSNIINLKITHRTTEFWDLFVDVEVKNTEHLSQIIVALRSIAVVNFVERV